MGTGPVARAVGRAFNRPPFRCAAVLSRDPARARRAAKEIGARIGVASLTELQPRAGTILLAVPDDAIAATARRLGAAGLARGRVLIHFSGALAASAMARPETRGALLASMHPLRSFAGAPKRGGGAARAPAARFASGAALRGTFFAIEGHPQAVRRARSLARAAGGVPVRVAPGAKPVYHAAAVMACNYFVALMARAVALLAAAGVDERHALRMLTPLVEGAWATMKRRGPTAALTGPVARGDVGTVASHLIALRAVDHQAADLYRALGVETLRLALRRGLPRPAALALRKLLSR
ncbi:MAG: DUF2520 domain-containing protein [Planctomycetes bacterium]|nr:DUF2520 domain-containing protein [Planctomycetota bacterium]